MKFLINMFMTAVSLGLTCTAFADNYSDLAAQGYRWATVDGPYACTTEQDLQRIAGHRNDLTELHMVENIRCYYLIPGNIVQVINEDSARGMSTMRLGSIIRSLWTYTKFLSKHPVQDTYGVLETPKNSGFIPTADTASLPALPSDSSTARTRSNGNP